ncbi:hypothetical protein BG006_006414 [Podila minutissima]|uniref:Cyanocobalamin reductase (cyanide-eliminating) n=1 Tax=Podila minutissima TaxID=64525 RepID=A0A9P5SIN4_9FUNG|nr:hypothetical protein BG006_006414 [Podila minutissima]
MTVSIEATLEQKRIFLTSLRRSLGQLGLDIVHPFAAQRTFWETFLAQHHPSKFDTEAERKDPMDHYCERLIPCVTLQSLKDAGLCRDDDQEFVTPFSVAFSHWRITVPPAGTPPPGSRPTGFVPPPAETLPIQHVAHAAGFAYFNPVAFLNVHPVYGPWFGMRAIVMVDLPYDISDNELLLISDTQPTGTYSRDSKPIESNPAFQRLSAEQITAQNAALEVTKTALLTKGWNAGDWEEWVAFRHSLTRDRPDWQRWRYSDNQMRYHYQKQPEFLEECAIKFQQGQEQSTSTSKF